MFTETSFLIVLYLSVHFELCNSYQYKKQLLSLNANFVVLI